MGVNCSSVATSIFALDSLGISTTKLNTPSPKCNGISCQGETCRLSEKVSTAYDLTTRTVIHLYMHYDCDLQTIPKYHKSDENNYIMQTPKLCNLLSS